MQAEDYQAVLHLWGQTPGVDLTRSDNPREFKRFLDRNPGFSFVAHQGDTLVGAVLCGHDGRRGFLHHLAVDPKIRRQGIASQLVEACLTALKEADIEKCHLFIRRDNLSGLEFWKQSGWQERITLTMASMILDDRADREDPNSC